jgi:hypothetical protein
MTTLREGIAILGATSSNLAQPNTNYQDLKGSYYKGVGKMACVDPIDPTSFMS